MKQTRVLERYAPLIGNSAAKAKARAERSRVWFAVSMSFFIVILLSASITNGLGLKIAAFASLIPVIVSICVRVWLRHCYLQVLSATAGVRIGGFHDVPLEPSAYENWCRKRGITPYELGDPTNKPVNHAVDSPSEQV